MMMPNRRPSFVSGRLLRFICSYVPADLLCIFGNAHSEIISLPLSLTTGARGPGMNKWREEGVISMFNQSIMWSGRAVVLSSPPDSYDHSKVI